MFTLCLNPIAWKLRATSGCKLSNPISCKVTHLLYSDDLKMHASSENNLERGMRTVKGGMVCIGLRWNEKKMCVSACEGRVCKAYGEYGESIKSLD